MEIGDELSCLIHAYLHRLEGHFDNARYWYRRAGGEEGAWQKSFIA